MQATREQQEQYELEHDTSAATERLAELVQAARTGDVALPRASRLVARLHSSVMEQLQLMYDAPVRGAGAKYKNWLRKLPIDTAALIAIRECISQCTASSISIVTVQSLALNVGRLYETEVRIAEAEMVNPVYMRKIHEQVKERCTQDQAHLRKVYNIAYDRIMKGEIDSGLIRSELMQLGKFGIDACMQAGLIEVVRGTGSKGMLVQYVLTEEVREYLIGYTSKDVANVVDREAGAMLCPPDDWTNLHDGGYVTPRRKMVAPLISIQGIRRSERARVAAAFTIENMPIVFEAVNYMQSIPFSVHMPTFNAINKLWKEGGGVLGVPTQSGPTKEAFPYGEDWLKDNAPADEVEVVMRWKRQCVRYYDELRSWRSKVRELGGFLRVAKKCPDKFWFPMYADRRGRLYYRGTPNPQGSDMAKAVLHFSEKKALGSAGLYWLKVSIANAYGYDKERFDDRARWTDQHWPEIENALDDPENHPDVWGDAPWCMFSAAWELREAYRTGNPTEYRTGVPVHMDATCSGLQHFSAMLRDPVGGRYVNLQDELQCGPKQDIYGRVASVALQAIERDLRSDDEAVQAMAAWWLNIGIPRSLAKKPCMTFVYGATLRGTAEFVRDYVETELKLTWPVEGESFAFSQYCAKKLFQGIAATVPAADEAMRWLRGIAQQQPDGQRMEWKTPTGFLVQHDYLGYDLVKVRIRSCGQEQVLIRNDTDGTNANKMQNAIAPNFVHAMDASHIALVAHAMSKLNLAIVGIHDSFGTHPCDVPKMHEVIRQEFVGMYSRNILAEFLWDVDAVGEVPNRGNLDLSQVIDSEFFFC